MVLGSRGILNELSHLNLPENSDVTKKMIARHWHGVVPKKHEEGFYQYLLATGISHSRSIPGNLGAQILKRAEADVVHFLMITFWTSLDAVKRFAGEHYDVAVLYADDNKYELVPDAFVTHFDVPYAFTFPNDERT